MSVFSFQKHFSLKIIRDHFYSFVNGSILVTNKSEKFKVETNLISKKSHFKSF